MPTTFLSDQLTNEALTPPTKTGPQYYGRRVTKHFTFTVPTATVAVNDLVQLQKIPAGALLLGGFIAFEAMSSGAGDASVQLGDGTTATKYLGTTSVDAAGKATFGDTIALNYGELLTSELTLTAKGITEAWVAGAKLKGHIHYLMP